MLDMEQIPSARKLSIIIYLGMKQYSDSRLHWTPTIKLRFNRSEEDYTNVIIIQLRIIRVHTKSKIARNE